MIELLVGIGIGICLLWFFSKLYCFKNKNGWNNFKVNYLRKYGKKKY